MKVKTIKVEIKDLDAVLKEAGAVMKKLAEGKDVEPREPAVVFQDLKTMRRVLSEKRLALLRAVRRHRPSSVYELAGLLNRNLRSVQYDVKILSELGFLELKKDGNRRVRSVPSVPYEKMIFEVAV
jgi:predicted transcriptional regulator